MKQGKLFVLSGPSGVGKGTVLSALLAEYKDINYSISVTTRKPRQGEIDGKDYFFLTEDKFFQMVKNKELIEWAKVHNNYYGTPKDYVHKVLREGQDIILELDIQGAKQVQQNFPQAIYIFLEPPSMQELQRRLNKRASENQAEQNLRLNNAKKELNEIINYDYIIVNKIINETISKLKAIIIAENCKVRR